MNNQHPLISHEQVSSDYAVMMEAREADIRRKSDLPHVTVAEQLDILHELATFELGRFLLQHRGLNGYWIHYIVSFPDRLKAGQAGVLCELEQFLLAQAPVCLATQQRFAHFLAANQASVKEHATLACIPSGVMAELLYLSYEGIHDIALHACDYEPGALADAKQMAIERDLSHFCHFHQQEAWSSSAQEAYDLISSNGLTIYEPDDTKVVALFKIFHRALRQQGRLVTSFLTLPPVLCEEGTCEWQFDDIDPTHLSFQRIVLSDVLQVKWQCYRTTAQTRAQLQEAGFSDIEFIYDKARIFPTVVAQKV